jgi:hypothetical protein
VSVLLDPQGNPIRVIEYHGKMPHSVTSSRPGNSYYDFNHCKRDNQVYWHESGGGPKTPTIELGRMAFPESPYGRTGVWLAPGERATVDGESLDEAGFDIITEQPPNPFDDAIEERCYWCDWCDDALPDTSPCEHLCDGCHEPSLVTLEADGDSFCGQCCRIEVDGLVLWQGEYARWELRFDADAWWDAWWEPIPRETGK